MSNRPRLFLLGLAATAVASSCSGGTRTAEAPPAGASEAGAPDVMAPGDDGGGDASDGGDTSLEAAGDADVDAPKPECVVDSDCPNVPHKCGTLGVAAGKCLVALSCDGRDGTFACGLSGDQNCCASSAVPAGSFARDGDTTRMATLSAFRLDLYEITVGRMRAFFEAFGGDPRDTPPAPGAGAHPLVANSGWRSTWNVRLPGSSAEIADRLGPAGCVKGGNNADGGTATWTASPGPYEDKPITCIDWYTLFAFCAWDGARIPTDAELGYAEMGGADQRLYSWGSDRPTFGTHYDYVVTGLVDLSDGVTKQTWGPFFRTTDASGTHIIGGPEVIAPPGKKPLGVGKWGQFDLTGNVLEWTLDVAPVLGGTCVDCANTAWPDPPQDQVGWYPLDWLTSADGGTTDQNDGYRSIRGGSWDPTHTLTSTGYYTYLVSRTYGSIGGRCARN
jgi:formylglycine-generating enzyme required for sulfatase activity